MERNILDIVKDKKLAQEIIAEYFTPVHEAQAKSTRLKNKMRERVQALNLSTKETKAMQKVGKISEAHAVQLLGEAMDNIRMLENSRGRMAERNGKTLSDWRGIVQEMWKQNPQLDKAKDRARGGGVPKHLRRAVPADERGQSTQRVRASELPQRLLPTFPAG